MTCNASPPRRGPSVRAAQILLIGYVVGFAVSVATALAALTAIGVTGLAVMVAT